MDTNLSTQTQIQPTNGEAMMPEMMGVKDLLNRSWANVKRNFGSLILLGLLNIGMLLMVLVGLGVTLLLGVGLSMGQVEKLDQFNWQHYLASLNPMSIILLIIIVLVLVITYSVISTAIGYGQIFLLADEIKQPLGVYIRKGFSLFIPALLVGLLTAILIIGNLFLLVIPAVIVGVYLSFTMHEVLLNNKRGMAALEGSATIISQHFGYVVLRVLVLVGIQFVIQIGSRLLRQSGDTMTGVLVLYSLITGILINWFFMAYIIELYKEVKEKTNWAKPARISWMWVTALLGWVLAFAIGFFMIRLLPLFSPSLDQIHLPQLEQNLTPPIQEN